MPTPLQQAEAIVAALQAPSVPMTPGRLPWLVGKMEAFSAVVQDVGIVPGGLDRKSGYLLVRASQDIVSAWEDEGVVFDWNDYYTSAQAMISECPVQVGLADFEDHEIFSLEPVLSCAPKVMEVFQEIQGSVWVSTHAEVVSERFAELVQSLASETFSTVQARRAARDILAR